MKKILNNSNVFKIYFSFLFLFVFTLGFNSINAQDEEVIIEQEIVPVKKTNKPARPAFETSYWFDGQTGIVNKKNNLEFVIQHRFSLLGSSPKELLGLYGPTTNTRLGLTYVPINKLMVGFGYTKFKFIFDLNMKYMILTQTKSNSMPISLTYYGNMGIEVQSAENYKNGTDRLSYFNQLIIMRRFSKMFSLQVAPAFIHYNVVKEVEEEDGSFGSLLNDSWGLNIGARFKVSSQIIIMVGYDTPLTKQAINQPLPSINFGIEIATSNHAFQIFFTNYNKIQPQEDFQYNQNDFKEGQWLIGFNITRLRAL
jgi:hypothetical protein